MAFEYTEPLGNITSADAIMIMTVEGLYPVGIPITNFSVDQMADSDEHEYAQARMGVDGGLAAGFVPNAWNVTVSGEAQTLAQGNAADRPGHGHQPPDLRDRNHADNSIIEAGAHVQKRRPAFRKRYAGDPQDPGTNQLEVHLCTV